MEARIHIKYGDQGLRFSDAITILSVLEDAVTVFKETEDDVEGRILKVENGSIWLDVFLPIAPHVINLFISYVTKKLIGKRKYKKRIDITFRSNLCQLEIHIDKQGND